MRTLTIIASLMCMALSIGAATDRIRRRESELADMLKKRGRPFIFASGYNLDRRNDFEPVDAVCVAKPYDQQSLSEALGVVLGKAA